MSEEYKPGMYVVVSDDNANIRREPRIIDAPVSNVVGQHKPGDHVEVYEILVDKKMMVWGRVSAVGNAGKANWMCIDTTNRALLKPVVTASSTSGKVLKVMIGDLVVCMITLD